MRYYIGRVYNRGLRICVLFLSLPLSLSLLSVSCSSRFWRDITRSRINAGGEKITCLRSPPRDYTWYTTVFFLKPCSRCYTVINVFRFFFFTFLLRLTYIFIYIQGVLRKTDKRNITSIAFDIFEQFFFFVIITVHYYRFTLHRCLYETQYCPLIRLVWNKNINSTYFFTDWDSLIFHHFFFKLYKLNYFYYYY